MTATHFRGSDGEIKIEGGTVTVVNFEITIETNVIASPRVGKVADMNYAGKQAVSGTISQVMITPELLSWVLSDTVTTSSVESLLAVYDMDDGAREEVAITNDPTDPTTVKVTVTAGTNPIGPGSIVIHGTNSSGGYITEVIDVAAMVLGDPAQVLYGSQMFDTTDWLDIEASLGVTGATDPTIKLDGIDGDKQVTPGNPKLFSIIGKVEDASSNFATITCNNCFFTGGNFPIGDSDTLVACDLPFVIRDADVDVTLDWSST